jgi:hypothetical protein
MLAFFTAINCLAKSCKVLVLKYQISKPYVKCFAIGIQSYVALRKITTAILDEFATCIFVNSINIIKFIIGLRLYELILLQFEFIKANIVDQVYRFTSFLNSRYDIVFKACWFSYRYIIINDHIIIWDWFDYVLIDFDSIVQRFLVGLKVQFDVTDWLVILHRGVWRRVITFTLFTNIDSSQFLRLMQAFKCSVIYRFRLILLLILIVHVLRFGTKFVKWRMVGILLLDSSRTLQNIEFN